jgi:hypothetical protein
MSADPTAEAKASRPSDETRGCLVGCLIIVVLGIIAFFPLVINSPYTHLYEFKYHYTVDIPARVLQILPPGFPTELAFRPPRYVVLPPRIKAIIISLAATSLACLLFVILYALRRILPWAVRLVMGLIWAVILIWILISICNWLTTPITL